MSVPEPPRRGRGGSAGGASIAAGGPHGGAGVNRWYAVLLRGWLLPGLVVLWLSRQDAITIERQVVDLAAQAGLPGTTAAVSWLGIVLWHCAAAVCWFAGTLLVGPEASGLRRAAVLSLLLGMDDALMLHEEFLPHLLHLSPRVVQPGLYCVYGVLLLGALKKFPRLWSRPEAGIFLAALLCLGGSIFVDMLKDSQWLDPRGRFLREPGYALWVEESLKLLGIAAWSLFWFRWASWLSRSGSSSGRVSLE
jgi:hypothetical protein